MPTKSTNFMILLLLVLTTLSPARTTFADGNSEETRKIVLALFEAFNRHDTDALLELYSENAKTRSPGDHKAQVGREGIRENYQAHFDNIPGVHDAVQNTVVEGERAAVEFIASWDQPNAEDANARGQLRIASFITVADGKIIEDMTYFDRQEFADAGSGNKRKDLQ